MQCKDSFVRAFLIGYVEKRKGVKWIIAEFDKRGWGSLQRVICLIGYLESPISI